MSAQIKGILVCFMIAIVVIVIPLVDVQQFSDGFSASGITWPIAIALLLTVLLLAAFLLLPVIREVDCKSGECARLWVPRFTDLVSAWVWAWLQWLTKPIFVAARTWRSWLEATVCVRISAWSSRLNQTMNRVADRVQDTLMDWDPEAAISCGDKRDTGVAGDPIGDGDENVETDPLPPLVPEAFVEAMRPELEDLLEWIALEINQAPNGVSISASAKEIREFLDKWTQQVIQTGEQMRVDAALSQLSCAGGGHTRWTEKFRRMKAAQGPLCDAKATD